MLFIGVIAKRKCFEAIKKKIEEEIKKETKEETIKFIPINLRSIENIKNIKFETLIVEDNLEKFKDNQKTITKIFENTQYVMINTDNNAKPEVIEKIPNKVTYGLNQKATVTVSSISETDILIYWQKNILNKQGKTIEIEEKRLKRKREKALKTYEILIVYAFSKIYNKSIMEEI